MLKRGNLNIKLAYFLPNITACPSKPFFQIYIKALTRQEGPKNGGEFYKQQLKKALIKTLQQNKKVKRLSGCSKNTCLFSSRQLIQIEKRLFEHLNKRLSLFFSGIYHIVWFDIFASKNLRKKSCHDKCKHYH